MLNKINCGIDIKTGNYAYGNMPPSLFYKTRPSMTTMMARRKALYSTPPSTPERYEAAANYFEAIGFKVDRSVTPPTIYFIDTEGGGAEMMSAIEHALHCNESDHVTTPAPDESQHHFHFPVVTADTLKEQIITIDSISKMD